MNRTIVLIIFTTLFLTSCFEAAKNTRQFSLSGSSDNSIGGGSGGGDGATNTGDGISGEDGDVIAKVELRHLIEPKVDDDSDGGEYKRKLTIPKNYNGHLYLAGINVSSLNSKNIKARFNFGVESQSITLDTTITTAPGLTPQTNVEVIVIDMRNSPFENVQLLYDLYDYNTYDYDSSGSDPGALTEPVQNNRNDKLFCRGVTLDNDPTFTGNLSGLCSSSSDVCKYAYAKVVDKGLVKAGTSGNFPSEINVQSATNYFEDADSIKVKRCLPDDPNYNSSNKTIDFMFSNTLSYLLFEQAKTVNGGSYIYRGPYRSINIDNWNIKSAALTGMYGLFEVVPDVNNNGYDETDIEYAHISKLFPLYTKYNLPKGSEYLGSILPDDLKTLQTMVSNSTSLWMDGCNERARTVHNITGEHIGSCNVTATIELVSIDENDKETVIDITDEVKLQLVKPAKLNTSGDNVLLSSFQQCSSSSQCGSDSCCINKRCWSKTLVSQCVEDLPNYGNQETGESCTSDYQCSSLCCNSINGRCAPHDTISDTPVYCSKASGQSCVAKEWCQKHPVTTCAIVDTGTDSIGGRTCALRCITAEVYGDCVSSDGIGVGTCVPPTQPDSPVFNPNDPNRCDEAITIAELIDLANNP